MNYEELNEKIKTWHYVVHEELYLHTSKLEKESKKIIFTNVGKLRALGQKSLTFQRLVRIVISASLCITSSWSWLLNTFSSFLPRRTNPVGD